MKKYEEPMINVENIAVEDSVLNPSTPFDNETDVL